MDLGIQGKVALVTGGSRGLGRHAALSLAREGAAVAICGRTQATLDSTVAELEALGATAIGVVADVSETEAAGSLHDSVVETLGLVDILVNNVGGSIIRTDITGTSLEDFEATFNLNVFGSYALMKLVVPHMRDQKWGRIINIASIWGREYGGNISYMAAKAALIGATKHAGVTLAKDGVLVNSIAPGSTFVEGGGWDKYQQENSPEVVRDFIDQNMPMGRFGWPEPLGDLVAFLASDRAGMITGACIPVDGGQGYSLT